MDHQQGTNICQSTNLPPPPNMNLTPANFAIMFNVCPQTPFEIKPIHKFPLYLEKYTTQTHKHFTKKKWEKLTKITLTRVV